MNNIFNKKVYVVVSVWSYPFGGGEEFLYQTMEWAHQLNMNTYWLSFTNPSLNGKPFENFTIEKYPFGTFIHIPDGFSEDNLYNWLVLLKPDIVHHQGHIRQNFFNVCERLRIEFCSGFHFWTGGIILDPKQLNVDILNNAKLHKPDPELLYLHNKKHCNLYTVTPFVSECIKEITNIYIDDHIYASSSIARLKIDKIDPLENKYVTVINIHHMKGGEILYYLLQNCPNIPFICIRTEFHSEELDKKIKDLIDERNKDPKCKIQSIFMERVANLKPIYEKSRIILVPTMADETFCRVINEAMMNGIPVITSGQGNTKYLVNNDKYVIHYSDKDKWKERLEELYFNKELLKTEIKRTLKNYELFSEKKAFDLFEQFTKKVLLKSKEMNIMIFTPWCDQGLGIQSRNYAKILDNSKIYNVFIFAVKPYNADNCIDLQKNPDEWKRPNIYYSPHDREKIKDCEIINFIKENNIGKCLLPETCWFRVFEIAQLLRKHHVKCYAIPNIEIVRRDEIFKHRYFHKILCNNKLCKNIFTKFGIYNTEYIGYGIDNIVVPNKKLDNNVVRFLFIGGMNAFSRKHILDICEAFTIAYKKCKNIKLTCTIQKTNLLEIDLVNKINEYEKCECIEIISKHLAYSDIFDLYNTNHISIQVSKHEGLGLGFYESTSMHTPIITLDTPPHNEIIIDNVNGWIIPCTYKKMTDNNDALFDSAYFDPNDLSDKIIQIVNNFKDYPNIIKKLIKDYNERLHVDVFNNKFLNSIN
ncbi:glycosyltransferase [Hokovirus HKV1]|uniref:Glycosyltransferase n=1 Tax=Hokovirus HKV1 TaxID=1977638 RepID=A0A1V0SG51_9VIRU|nr:glycosyltransferase [Hokovirus HKV1]